MSNFGERCPVCDESLANPIAAPSRGWFFVECRACGRFQISDDAFQDQVGRDLKEHGRMAVSHALNRMTRRQKNSLVQIDAETIERLGAQALPSLADQVDNLVEWIAETVKGPGYGLPYEDVQLRAVTGAISTRGASFVVEHARQRGWIMAPGGSSSAIELFQAGITLTFQGWQRHQEVREHGGRSRLAFMAMAFGNAQLDQIFEGVLVPAVKQTGFDLLRVIDKLRAGLIDDHLRVDLRRARFVIADLTHENRGAYWEAGFAEGLGKPVIYTCREDCFKKSGTHFDTNHHLTVLWNPSNLDEAARQIKATIRNSLPGDAVLSDAD